MKRQAFLLIGPLLIMSLACNLGVVQVNNPVATATVTSTSLIAETQTSTPDLPTATQIPPTSIPPSATPIIPTNTPFPTNTAAPVLPDWPLIRTGDEGPNVSALQHLLNHHNSAIGADGSFGPQTRTAVQHFQSNKGLSVDGIVGPQTWGALIQIGLFREGASGHKVRAVQTLLKNKFGFPINVDGIFGPKTDQAVRGFQQCHNLAVDGVVGEQTWKALIAINPITC